MSQEKTSNPLVPIAVVVAIPVIVCLILMLTDEGIERSLLWAAIKTGIILTVLGGAISFGVSRLAERNTSR
ncbi:hypothetical protein [Methylobacterium frigidaeris]|uniref:Uncharacterized protein n=1 Tax=Methylobacterium frigidaeris TaxID=2038277 RepID=A0AA37HHS4_9HYPH|nr:hypothetical protein [Methylobacterium frigidaeris]PIK74192.1 hypothetical protein CS379_03865 [Methylobacterium frigidaeris]GJD66136.1 hypothetical protein MPEAHAMD_6332 [Methylobacterium frigidaeris]